MVLKIDDVVLCTVVKIEGTTVFLQVAEESGYEMSMTFSEVAAGRIRNLREYVAIGKKIVCKVLKLSGNHAELSLRRVTGKEREEVLERHKKERALKNMLKSVVSDADKLLSKIKEEYDVFTFIEEIRENPKLLEKYVDSATAKKLSSLVAEKEGRSKKVSETFSLRTNSSTGVCDIRDILQVEADVHYLGSSLFSVSVSASTFKEANAELAIILEKIEKQAAAKKAVFEVGKDKRG